MESHNKSTRAQPYSKTDVVTKNKNTIIMGGVTYRDTGGGFLLEVIPDKEETPVKLTQQEAPIIPEDQPTCETCNKTFATSWLFDTFNFKVCDDCKDPEIHTLITKTEAMKEYLLKDCDISKREPSLKFITRKNPHNVRWGDMKLYLRLQIEERALEIWETPERIEEELEKREAKKLITKGKKYQKQMKELRMSMRSSLYDRTTASHTHQFGPETPTEDEDTYTRTCETCQFVETYEKL